MEQEPSVRAFKIWYSDHVYMGDTYQAWTEGQDDDVQVVVVYFDKLSGRGLPLRMVYFGDDFYGFDGERFSSHFDDVTRVTGHIKYGKYMDFDDFMELKRRALEDYGRGWLIPGERAEPEDDGMEDVSASGKEPEYRPRKRKGN